MIIHICILSKCVQQFIFGEKVLEMARRRLRSFSNVREKEATICFYLPPFIFWNTQTSLYEAEGCVFLFFFNIPQYSVIFYNIQQYFILAKNFQCEAEGKRSHFDFHYIFTFTIQRNFCVINKGRHHLLCLFRKQ